MLYSFSTVFTYSVYEVRVVATHFYTTDVGNLRTLFCSCLLELLLCCVTEWIGDCPHMEEDAIRHILRNPKVHYRVQECQPTILILSQMNPGHAPNPLLEDSF